MSPAKATKTAEGGGDIDEIYTPHPDLNVYQRVSIAKRIVARYTFSKVKGQELKFPYLPIDQVKPGVQASQIAKDFYKYFCDNGYKDNFVYGPLHGTGMIEVEAPWCETSSEYELKPNMLYQVDTFISADTFGVRWEKGIAVREGGCEILSPEIPEICPELLF